MRMCTRLCVPLALFLASAAAGCGDDGGDGAEDMPDAGTPDAAPDAAVAPVFRNAVELPDAELADAALKALGAPVPGANDNCGRCHGVTRERMRYWRDLGVESLDACLTDLEVQDAEAARAMIDCLRAKPSDPESAFEASKLGQFSTAAHLPWFAHLFELAYGDEGAGRHEEFVEQVGMPQGGASPLDQDGFDIVAEYFDRGLPLLEQKLTFDPPTECEPSVAPEVATHVDEMTVAGWGALNTEAGILMHGCGGAETPRECLTDEPRVQRWENVAGVVRRLQVVPHASAYWTRSSADGRFVAHGVDPGGAAFVDLQTDAVIPADALYDPGFFPDNSGFAFQRGSQALFCEQVVLNEGPAEVTFGEPTCTSNGEVGLYQHLGAALGGGDYWAVHGQFTSDDGGKDPTTGDPSAQFSEDSSMRLTPMIHQGTGQGFDAGETVGVDTPYEGDAVMSPSARLVISRVAGPTGQLGFLMRAVVATQTPAGYEVTAPEVARYCVNGGKPSFSFDERLLTYHHYVEASDAEELGFEGPDDPAFAPYLTDGAANVYILDILTGQTQRVTNMAPGEYALYPHFRSDGWIYFMVREVAADESETIAATDAALVPGK
jgi:hypothetical protein